MPVAERIKIIGRGERVSERELKCKRKKNEWNSRDDDGEEERDKRKRNEERKRDIEALIGPPR